ncbi:unnamed protein product [Cochlearia groenlandica]
MAEAIVSFGLQALWDLLSQEYEQLQGVEDQVSELKRDMNLLSCFLKDADAKKHASEVVKNCVEEVKDIIFDAEDIIETFLLKEGLGKSNGFRKRVKKYAFTMLDRRELASDIGGISKRISKVIRDMKSFGVQQMIANNDYHTHPLQEKQRQLRHEFAKEYDNNLVGLEANVKKLVKYLTEENIQVVYVTGMCGVGKTTLARQVFNDEIIKHKFDGLAWVCVSQEFTRRSVWQTILRNLKPKEEDKKILHMTEATLQNELFQLLETSKSLVVLDDVWRREDWDLIKPIFSRRKGWKVLLTSRNENVVAHEDTTYINFKPQCLTIQDSWTLFQRIAMPRKYASERKVNVEMEEMGKRMIKICGGIPLAVRVLGGLLAVKYTLQDWERVFNDIGSHIIGRRPSFNDQNNISFYHILSLSFEELSIDLKHCFLYLAHFPEDYAIPVQKLFYYWVADGILKPKDYDGEAIQDVGDRYIEELVRRNMVISERDATTLRFETCRLHDLMREICLIKVKEENFLQIAGIRSSSSNSKYSGTPRRLVWQYPNILDVEKDINNPKLRSLLVVSDYLGESWKLSNSSFSHLELLRVLDLSFAKFEGGKLSNSIGKLLHLQYLSLAFAKVSHLPSSLQNLKLLIYLHLGVSEEALFVPNVLMGMDKLRYLELPCTMHEKTKLELSNLVNLENLENFSTENSKLEDLHGMARLRTLKLRLTNETTLETLSASLERLRNLEHLDIEGCGFDGDLEENGYKFDKKIEEGGFFLTSIHLKYLSLSIHLTRLPNELHFPSHLTTISLYYCCLEEDPMPILEKLLHLKSLFFYSQSFCGRELVCSDGGFPQLEKLELWGLYEWEEWILGEGSMSLLHTLHICMCEKLKELPDGLRFIYSLKDLSVYYMGEKWKGRLSQGGEDYYIVQRIPSVTFK